jgi:hypothetical protein
MWKWLAKLGHMICDFICNLINILNQPLFFFPLITKAAICCRIPLGEMPGPPAVYVVALVGDLAQVKGWLQTQSQVTST